MKNNIITSITAILFVTVIAVPAVVLAQTIPATGTPGQGGALTGSVIPTTGVQGQGGATVGATIPDTGTPGQGGASTGSTIPTTGTPGQGGASTGSTIPTTGTPGQGGASTGTDNGGNTGGNTGGEGTPGIVRGGGGGSLITGGSSATTTLSTTVTLPPLANIGQCRYITTYLKFGQANSSAEVTKLQTFLRDVEKMNVSVTGTFDLGTLRAVEAFQAKYVVDVLHPWGASIPSGYVYHTTSKKINELYCKTNFSLTPAQLAEIEAYRTRLQSGRVTPSTNIEVELEPIGSVTTPSTVAVSGTTTTSTSTNTQVAAVGKTPVFTKIWNLIKRVFGR